MARRMWWSGKDPSLGRDKWELVESESEGLSCQAEGAVSVNLASVPSLPEVYLRQEKASTVEGGTAGDKGQEAGRGGVGSERVSS